jgi:hypothetical protein
MFFLEWRDCDCNIVSISKVLLMGETNHEQLKQKKRKRNNQMILFVGGGDAGMQQE